MDEAYPVWAQRFAAAIAGLIVPLGVAAFWMIVSLLTKTDPTTVPLILVVAGLWFGEYRRLRRG